MQLSSSKWMQMSFNLIPFRPKLNQAGELFRCVIVEMYDGVLRLQEQIYVGMLFKKNWRLDGRKTDLESKVFFSELKVTAKLFHISNTLRAPILVHSSRLPCSLFFGRSQLCLKQMLKGFFFLCGQSLRVGAVLRDVLAEAACCELWPLGAKPAEESLL